MEPYGGGDNGDQQPVWLCAECTETFVVQIWRPAGEQLRLRRGDLAVLPYPTRPQEEEMEQNEELLALKAG